MPTWTADKEITIDEAVGLIRGQFPSIPVSQAEPLGDGWDNRALLIDNRSVFRFPRRNIAANLILTEAKVLPVLAPHLPLPIPSPNWLGQPTQDYPFPFSGYTLIPGITACCVEWTDEQRTTLAKPLAQFLAALHSIPVSESEMKWAPRDEIRRTDLVMRAELLEGRIPGIESQLEAAGLSMAEICAMANVLAAVPRSDLPLCWVHGDLYARHLVVNEERQLCGVIDWGDVHLGERFLDISIAFSFLPPEARPLFRAAYGEIDEATWKRARFRALSYGVILIEYGSAVDDQALVRAGVFALRSAMIG